MTASATAATPLDFERRVADALARLDSAKAVGRLTHRDATLWPGDASVHASIRNRLGWLAHIQAMRDQVSRLADFARVSERRGHDRVVVVGMGGSSLWPEVIGKHLRRKRGLPLRVIDSTHPEAAAEIVAWAAAGDPMFLIATKSGGTVETLSLYRVLRTRFPEGRRFNAITDPGSPLVELAEAEGFREVFLNPPDIGGRFSATTLFGLVPAALAGVDLHDALDKAQEMLNDCSEPVAARNPAAQLAATLFAGHESGRWLVRLSLSKDIAGFAAWVEQLVAESSGKQGVGLLPVPGALRLSGGELATAMAASLLVGSRTFSHPDDPFVDACDDAAVPTHDIVMPSATDLWAEVVRWEVATALLGVLLGINPFDEPDVSAAKHATSALLSGARTPVDPTRAVSAPSMKALGKLLGPELGAATSADLIAVLAYVAPTEANLHRLAALRDKLQAQTAAAVTVQVGPRYLHSTGQLHKGGPARGRFVVVHDHDRADLTDVEIPGGGTLLTLVRAQAQGDVLVLRERGLPVTLASLHA